MTKQEDDRLFPWEDEPPAGDTPAAADGESTSNAPEQHDGSAASASPAPPAADPGPAEALPAPAPSAAAPAEPDPRRASSSAAPPRTDAGPGERGDAPAAAHRGESATARGEAQRPLVRKEYYSISEVSDLVGLPAHVLRYWESQFSVLNPSKNRSGNRVYQRKEIKLILLVKQLLHEEKYTVEGAKQKLEQLRRGGGIGKATAQALDEQLLRVLREDLQALGDMLKVEDD